MRTVQYELMRPAEIVRTRAGLPVAFVPLGPIEWHGPHLPLGTDALHAHAVAVETAGRVGGIVLPALFAGSESVLPNDQMAQSPAALGFDGTPRIVGMDFPGNPVKSLYFEEGAFAVTVRELLRALKADCYRLIVIVNGHGAVGHQQALRRLAIEESDPPRTRVVYTLAFVPPAPPFTDPGHAEKVETSILLALNPDLVDLSALPARGVPIRYRDHGIVDGPAFDGYPTPDFTVRAEADPREATAQFGRAVLDAEVARLVGIVRGHIEAMGLPSRKTG
jgi:creatinine amidohydrolase